MRIIFMGTSEFAVPSLNLLHDSEHDLLRVYTRPARQAGRGLRLEPSPIAREAERLSLSMATPASLAKPDEIEGLRALRPDLIVVVSFGLRLVRDVLAIPTHGCVNLHPSLLPRWRGAAPIERTIMAGDDRTGTCLIQMAETLDTGPILGCQEIALDETVDAGMLHDRLATCSAELLGRMLPEIIIGSATPSPQREDGVCHAPPITGQDTRIDWNQDAVVIDRQIRGLAPRPGAWAISPNGDRLRILAARPGLGDCSRAPGTFVTARARDNTVLPVIACGRGEIALVRVQLAGKRAVDAASFLRGAHFGIDGVFS